LSLHTTESRAQHDLPTLNSTSSPFRRIKYAVSDFIRQHKEIQLSLFPTLVDFKKKSFFSKISSLLSAPVVFLLAATLPVVKESSLNNTGIHLSDDTADLLQDYNDEDDISTNADIHNLSVWNRWLTAVQFVCFPMLISFVMVTQDIGPWYIIFPVCVGIGIITAAAFWFTTSPYKQPPLYWMMCFVGFGIAVVWIFLIANEVVSVLQAIGMALGVSEAILGLTVFALVSN
jgi:sodium/potassium/calcium exchanger 6